MSNIRVARHDGPKIKPAFIVEKLSGKRERTVIKTDAKGMRHVEVVQEDAGYLVRFPKGHSIRVRNDAELARLGYDRTVPLIDEDGEVVGEIDNHVKVGEAA